MHKSERAFLDHIIKHTGGYRCHVALDSAEGKDKEEREAEGGRVSPSPLCDKGFASKEKLRTHMLNAHEVFYCDFGVCGCGCGCVFALCLRV